MFVSVVRQETLRGGWEVHHLRFISGHQPRLRPLELWEKSQILENCWTPKEISVWVSRRIEMKTWKEIKKKGHSQARFGTLFKKALMAFLFCLSLIFYPYPSFAESKLAIGTILRGTL